MAEHSQYGFGLMWRSRGDDLPSNILLSSSQDSTIAIWDVYSKEIVSGALKPTNALKFHEKAVDGLDILH